MRFRSCSKLTKDVQFIITVGGSRASRKVYSECHNIRTLQFTRPLMKYMVVPTQQQFSKPNCFIRETLLRRLSESSSFKADF